MLAQIWENVKLKIAWPNGQDLRTFTEYNQYMANYGTYGQRQDRILR